MRKDDGDEGLLLPLKSNKRVKSNKRAKLQIRPIAICKSALLNGMIMPWQGKPASIQFFDAERMGNILQADVQEM